MGSTQQQFNITLTLNGTDAGTWDKLTGGDPSATTVKYRPGGMVPEIDLGGPMAINDITITRNFDVNRDGPYLQPWAAACGRWRGVITQQPLDVYGSPAGAPWVRSGVLKSVKPPEADSMGTSAAMVELSFSIDGVVG